MLNKKIAENNIFVGTMATKTWKTDPVGVYGFASGNNTVEPGTFVRVKAGSSIKPFRGYIQMPTASAAKLMINLGGTVTSIDNIYIDNAQKDTDAPVYNLTGQRVDSSYKGVVIKNGKKILQK